MSRAIWRGDGPIIADTSAWITARRIPDARDLLLAAVERGDVAWCWPVRYELMIDARSIEAIEAVDSTLDGLREIRVDAAIQRDVLSIMRDFARRGPHGAHRLPLTDLTVAAAARTSGLPVLHYDGDFDRLAALLDIDTRWLADA